MISSSRRRESLGTRLKRGGEGDRWYRGREVKESFTNSPDFFFNVLPVPLLPRLRLHAAQAFPVMVIQLIITRTSCCRVPVVSVVQECYSF